MAPRRSRRLQLQIHDSQDAGMARGCSPRLHPQIQANGEGAGATRRRSPRLHPQIQANGEGAGATRRRSPRLHPQIHARSDVAGVTCRLSLRVHPQIHASEQVGAGMARRTDTSPAAADAFLPLDDHMLREILLRLPPQPSALPRASAVCTRWRRLVTDPKFHRQFCAHHRKPPLLGYFHRSDEGIVFSSVLDPPNRIPPQHFDLGHSSTCQLLDCRHGHILVQDNEDVVVWNLFTRVQRRVAVPVEFRSSYIPGAVLCAVDHVHGSCHSSPFKVVLVSRHKNGYPLIRVYSSETDLWGNLISTEYPLWVSYKPVVMVGNCLYWFSFGGILEFDVAENSLTVTGVDLVTHNIESVSDCQIIEAEDGVLGFAGLSYPHLQLWKRNVSAHGVSTWEPWKTIDMHCVPGLPSPNDIDMAWLLGYDEDTDVMLSHSSGNACGIQLKPLQFSKLYEIPADDYYYPFKSFYTPAIAGEVNGAEMLHIG